MHAPLPHSVVLSLHGARKLKTLSEFGMTAWIDDDFGAFFLDVPLTAHKLQDYKATLHNMQQDFKATWNTSLAVSESVPPGGPTRGRRIEMSVVARAGIRF